MLINVYSWLKKSILQVLLLSAVSCYLVFTIPAFFSDNHFFYNLEPYPDGLLYALSARNFVLGRGLDLSYFGVVLKPWVPPLYSLVLVLGYVVTINPTVFFAVNVLLGVISLFLLWLILKKHLNHSVLVGLGLCLYLLHGYIIFLPSLPLSENLALPLFLLATYGLLSYKFNIKDTVFSIVGLLGLILTRYSVVFMAATFGIWTAWKYRKVTQKSLSVKKSILLTGSFFLLCILFVQTQTYRAVYSAVEHLSKNDSSYIFYNFKYIPIETKAYFSVLTGRSAPFLWLQTPLTSFTVSMTAILALIIGVRNAATRVTSFKLVSLLLAQLLPLFIFYYTDARYVIYTIPLFCISIALFLNSYYEWIRKHFILCIVLVVFVLGFHLRTQQSLFKLVLSDSVLQHSQAWQYRSIQTFNTYFSAHPNSLLITTLPPFLVDAYQTSSYRVLPMSLEQEFLQKEQYVWGADVPYSDLITGYTKWIEEGRPLYISNAYITHQQSVIRDYEVYKNTFNFELVQSGCLDACNLYKLTLKE